MHCHILSLPKQVLKWKEVRSSTKSLWPNGHESHCLSRYSQPTNKPFLSLFRKILTTTNAKKKLEKKKDLPEKETTEDNAPARSSLLHYLGRQKPAHITYTSKGQT